jgi:hypothetical protein
MHLLACCGSPSSAAHRIRDANDAERLRHNPAMRRLVGGKAAHGNAASPSQMVRFENPVPA